MLDQKLKPWMIEVNHTPSFNVEGGTDADVKNDLVLDCLKIIELSIDQRKRTAWDMKREAQQQPGGVNGMKRMTAKEHSDRVRFDPTLVAKRLPKNGFRLIYPADAPGADPDLYRNI